MRLKEIKITPAEIIKVTRAQPYDLCSCYGGNHLTPFIFLHSLHYPFKFQTSRANTLSTKSSSVAYFMIEQGPVSVVWDKSSNRRETLETVFQLCLHTVSN